MYTQNSNRDLFLSQQWSQIDSQDWNTQISQELSHRVPSTPSGRSVLPPTPSTSGNQNANLSNSWSGRALSQVVPQSASHPSTPRGVNRENNFFREIRFALHAVLSVMRDLPGKLQEVVLSSSGNKNSTDALLCENLRKIVEEKMTPLEKIVSVIEKYETVFADNKKSYDVLSSGMEEFQKSLRSHSLEVTNLNDEVKARTEALKKQFNILRKLCLTESRKTQSILLDLKSSSLEKPIEEMGKKISIDIENLITISNSILHHLQEKEEEETSTLKSTLKEITLLKTYVRDLPSIIDASVQEALNRRGEIFPTPLTGKNVRLAGSWNTLSPLVNNPQAVYRHSVSPVARVAPQVKAIPWSSPRKLTYHEPTKKEMKENVKFVLDVIDYTSSKENSPFPLQIRNSKREKSETDSVFASPLISGKAFSQTSSPLVFGSKRLEETDNFPPCSLYDLRKERMKKIQHDGDVVFVHKPVVRYRP